MYYIKTHKLYQILILFCLLTQGFLLSSCKRVNKSIYSPQKYKVFEKAAISTAHPEATKIGLSILDKGGNAIDAAIATQFALAVCYPIAGNIGGGGFMVYREKAGAIYTLDFREKAPENSSERMYQDSSGQVIEDLSTLGHLAAGVPGTVDGMFMAFERFSALKDWKVLIQPSIELAKNGFKLSEQQVKYLEEKREQFQQVNGDNTAFTSKKYVPGDLFVQTDLSRTLTMIRDYGRDGFYSGKTADLLVKEMRENGGIMNYNDLANYKSVWREPVSFLYKNYTIHSMGPPSSGGILLAQLFNAASPYPLKEWGHNKSRTTHLMVEAEKRAFADRAKHMGDMDFYDVPTEKLISADYTRVRMADFSESMAISTDSIHAGEMDESEQTTHYSIVDKFGNAVSLTTTLNAAYGSKVVVDGAGFILNNEMDDFSVKVGFANMYGLVGAEANKIEPGKRMLSSMTPTIVEKDGELFMVVGTPGGSTIITSVYQVILNVIEHEMNAGEAVSAARFHHQWKPKTVAYEKGKWQTKWIQEMTDLGHELEERSSIGRVEAIVVKNGLLQGAADPRGDDDVQGL